MTNIKQKEKGAILPFVAISLILIISLLALIFDFGAMTITKSDLRDTARVAATSALRAYVEDLNQRISANGGNSTPQIFGDSFQVALAAANTVTELNLAVSTSSDLRAGTIAEQSELGNSGNMGTGGFVQPGTWHFVERDFTGTGQSRPDCYPAIGEPFVPCFEVLGEDEAASAFRVVLNDEQRRTNAIFSSVVGFPMNTVGGDGSASFVPRQGVVSFDLSASVTRSSHFSANRADGRKSEYAFYVDPSNFPAGQDPCVAGMPEQLLQTEHQITWNGMLTDDQDTSGVHGALEHYQGDYSCVDIDITIDGNTDKEYFLIETGGNPQAEPLDSILRATNTLLNEFVNRRVVGDKVGAFGFDQQVLAQRRLALEISDPNGTIITLVEPIQGEADFESFRAATNIDVTPFAARKDSFLFPRVFTGLPTDNTRQIATTNLQTALGTSLQMLQSSNTFGISDNFILIITDGISNCVQDTSMHDGLLAPDANGNQVRCFNASNNDRALELTDNYIRAGFNEIFNIGANTNTSTTDLPQQNEISGTNTLTTDLSQQIAEEGVRLHIALIGDHVGPHTLVRPSPGGGCMTFNEAEAQGLTMVEPQNNTPFDPSSEDPFFFPNNLASAAGATGGQWWPILRPCEGTGLTQEVLDQACDNVRAAEGQTGGDPSRAVLPSDIPPSDSQGNPITIEDPDFDAQGRLLCKPNGANVQEQLEELIDNIISDSPIILVE